MSGDEVHDKQAKQEFEGSDRGEIQPELITSFDGFEVDRELSSSRFGSTQLVRRRTTTGDWEYFVAKCYNKGRKEEDPGSFMKRMSSFLNLQSPSIMGIKGLIPPTNDRGPVVLTPFSECGSLEDVLNQVRRNQAPPWWNSETKERIIGNLIRAFEYLHNRGIIHQGLKPSDIIVQSDGTVKVCGYLTSYLEEHKFTKASQIGAPFYMAPEIYDKEGGTKSKGPKMDVFSFGLIAFEIFSIIQVFPSSMLPGRVMRKARSFKPEDRPKIPGHVSRFFADMIRQCWVPFPSQRPSFTDILKQIVLPRIYFSYLLLIRTEFGFCIRDDGRTESACCDYVSRFVREPLIFYPDDR